MEKKAGRPPWLFRAETCTVVCVTEAVESHTEQCGETVFIGGGDGDELQVCSSCSCTQSRQRHTSRGVDGQKGTRLGRGGDKIL